jgi:tRNA-Thr(GGU) m(6)t(6)A37 methyltransferase TsaA
MTTLVSYSVHPIVFIRSDLKLRDEAPRQGLEGAPDAWLEVSPRLAEGMPNIVVRQEIIVVTWLHEAERNTLKAHPRDDVSVPLTGVFSTRSPDRPNPLGLHRVTVCEIVGNQIRIAPIEAIDGTPVADVKPVLRELSDS